MSKVTFVENDLPRNWIITELKNIASVKSGGTPSTINSDYWGGDIPWINSGKLKDKLIFESSKFITKNGLENSSAKLFPENTVVIALTGSTTAKVGFLTFSSTTNQSVTGILPNSFYIPKYLFYSLIFEREQILSNKLGSAQPHINQRIVENTKIAFCPLNEQKRIVEKIEELLFNLEHAKTALEKIKPKLKEYRQSFLKQAFEGKLTKKWREVNKEISKNQLKEKILFELKMMNKKTSSEFLDKVQLPKLPDSWTILNLDSLTNKIVDGTHFSPTFVEKGIPFISAKNIKNEKIEFSNCKFIPKEEHLNLIKRCKPELHDVLMSKSGTIGRTAVIKTDIEFSLCESACLIKPIHKFLNSHFLSLYLEYYTIIHIANHGLRGVAVKHFQLIDIKKIPIPTSSINEQKEIVLKLEQGLSLIQNTENIILSMLSRLDILQFSVLKQAFKGKLVVQNLNDESAEVLLQKIRQEKELLIQKQKPSSRNKNVK